MYAVSNFLGSYTPTSKTVRILLPNGKPSFTIFVCNYQKSSVFGNTLNIILEGNTKEYKLEFATESDARQALALFKQAVDTLKPNCSSSGGGGTDPSPTPVSITYLAYKVAQTNNTLLALQWYDVVDTTGLILTSGTTMRLQALSTNDISPAGIILDSTQAFIKINCIDDTIVMFEDSTQKVNGLNLNVLPTYDINSSDIIVENMATVNAINSHVINISGGSSATLTSCNYVNIRGNSTITLQNAVNVNINNIQQDMSSIGFVLNDVSIDQTDSIGKNGSTDISVGTTSVNTTLIAYRDLVNENYVISASNATVTVVLNNPIPLANAEFKIRYTGTGTGNTIVLNNVDSSNVYTITDGVKNATIVVRYIKSTNKWLVSAINYAENLKEILYVPTVTNNQTSFTLPTPATKPLQLQMFVNGQKMVYGSDFTYTSSGQQVTFTNFSFVLASTDVVEFLII